MARPNYYAIIPADVRYDDKLPAAAKLLYGEISALADNIGRCVEPNQYFAELYQVTERSVSRLIAALEDAGFIRLETVSNTRIIRLSVSTTERLCGVSFPPEGRQKFLPPTTKISTPQTKMSTLQDSTVVGDILNNNLYTTEVKKEEKEKKKEKPRLDDKAMQALFVAWIADNFPDADRRSKNRLYRALDDFYAPRERKDQEPQHTERGFNGLKNRLERSCGSDIDAMLSMLDTATCAGWKSVFPEHGKQAVTTEEVRYGFGDD